MTMQLPVLIALLTAFAITVHFVQSQTISVQQSSATSLFFGLNEPVSRISLSMSAESSQPV
jgi:hypothetical protein